jgi:hypothetical protein
MGIIVPVCPGEPPLSRFRESLPGFGAEAGWKQGFLKY